MTFSQIIFLLSTKPSATNINVVKLFQILQSTGTFIIPSIIAYYLFYRKSKNDFIVKIPIKTIIYIILAILVFIPIINYIAYFNSKIDLPNSLQSLEDKMKELEKIAETTLKYFFIDRSLKGFIINFIMIAIISGIGEELFFRGILQNILIEWFKNKHTGIIVTAVIFSFIHFQFYGFIPRFLLGVYFGYLLFISSSIWIPIIAHIANNGIAVINYYITNEEIGNGYIDKVGTRIQDIYLLIICSLLFIFFNYMIIKFSIKSKN